MKKAFMTLAIIIIGYSAYSQTEAGLNVAAIGLGANSTEPNYKFSYFDKSVAHYGIGWYNDPGFTGGPMAYLGGYGGMKFFTEFSVRLFIEHSGNIGIGTTTPDAKLAVKGTIHTQEVKVDMNGWSDFVFDKTYPLPTLSSVKAYIDQNHHLPEIPSEAEVIKNGVNLGEMVKLQTKKIEELTLYAIDQQKQIEQLKIQIDLITKSLTKN